MSFADEIRTEVDSIFKTKWNDRTGEKVPLPEDVKLDNDRVKIEGSILYADLAESTNLVDNYPLYFAAEIYKAYILAASRAIKLSGGEIRSFDGDRVMGVFMGKRHRTRSALTGLKINYLVDKVINPLIPIYYSDYTYRVDHAVGVDSGTLYVSRTGIRGSNDLVWVGSAANYSAKLCSLRQGNVKTWITSRTFDSLADDGKTSGGKNIWTQYNWNSTNMTVYGSSWHWWGDIS